MTEKLNIPVPKSKSKEISKAVEAMRATAKTKVDIATSKMKTEQAIRKSEEIGRKVALDREKADQRWSETKFRTKTAIANFDMDQKLLKQMGIVAFNEYKKKQADVKSKMKAGKSSMLRK